MFSGSSSIVCSTARGFAASPSSSQSAPIDIILNINDSEPLLNGGPKNKTKPDSIMQTVINCFFRFIHCVGDSFQAFCRCLVGENFLQRFRGSEWKRLSEFLFDDPSETNQNKRARLDSETQRT